ncbi:protein VASP homolog [Portunus trituberculatus]|uniref:protein VASP homolog n=1 Tax=Portunus trituberculatus TaxID=210409 RepID=UPI001E1CDF2D|nr:protein VASP homolog [Portunus trituberculatus]
MDQWVEESTGKEGGGPQPQREPATDDVSRPRLHLPRPTSGRRSPPSRPLPLTCPSLPAPPLALRLHLPCPPSLPQRTATVPPVPPKTVPQPDITKELPATDATRQLMAVMSVLAAKVDNLSATVSGLSNEFAAFKSQQHTVCSGTSTVAPTPYPASGAQWGQGESDVYQHSLCDPPKKKDNAAGQCATAAAPSPRMDTPTKPVKGAMRQPQSPSWMAPASPATEQVT